MLSEKFKTALKLAKEPQYRLAWKVGLHPNSLSKLVTGYLKPKRYDTRLLKLARLLKVPREEIFKKEDQ